MKYFLRICLVYLCTLALSHTYIQAQAPVIDEVYYYNGGGFTPISPTNIPINTPIYLHFDQPVFKTDGTAFLNNETVATLITFSGGITFTATISGRWITIIPTAQLLLSPTTYNIGTAGNFQNAAAEVNSTQPVISFTTAAQTTVTAPTLDLCRNGVPKVLGNIVITEGSTASFGEGINQTFEMNAPTGFNFVAGVGTATKTPTSTDVSNLSMFVSTTKITVLYSVSNAYASTDVITLEDIQVVWVSGSASQNLRRTGGNASQAANRPVINGGTANHAVFSSTLPPAIPAVIPNINLCSGFALTDTRNFNIVTGSTVRFYDVTNTLIPTAIATIPAIPGTFATISFANLGYTSNTTLGTSQFYMSEVVGTCESPKRAFTITVNPNPVVNLVVFSGSTAICTPNQTTFEALGTSGATFTFERSFNGAPFVTVTSGAFYTTPTNLIQGNYQLQVRATLASGCFTVSNVEPFTVNPKPAVGFIPPLITTFATSNGAQDITDGALFGGTIGGVVSNLGTYSGTGVSGTQFFPAVAGIGSHVITYSYTAPNGCYNEASVTFTVATSTSLIPNLGTSYCANASITLALTPNGGPPFAFTLSRLPRIGFLPTIPITSPYPGLGSLGNDKFYFPIMPGFNEGIELNGINEYVFNPSSITFAGLDAFKDVQIKVTRFISIGGFTYVPINDDLTVKVYRLPVIDMNLIDGADFCRNTSAPFVVNPLVFGVAPTTGTTDVEYRISSGTFAPLPSNTIVPNTLPIGNYFLRVTHTTTQGCSSFLERTFQIINNPSPTFVITNNSNVITNTFCSNEPSIRLERTNTPFFGSGVYTITKIAGATSPFSMTGITTTIALASLSGAGSYQVTLTLTNLAGCSGTSVVGTFDIIPVPLPNFTFAPLATPTLTICEDANIFTLIPNTGALPVGSGFFNIKKTSTIGVGKSFATGINSFDPLVDFDATSGIGAGTYEIKYTYITTAGGCQATMLTAKVLTIAPKPILDFTLSQTNICNNLIKPTILLAPTWINAGGNTLVPANSKIAIYNSANVFLVQLTNTNIIDPNISAITSNIVGGVITTFRVEYEYLDGNGCVGVSAQKTFTVSPLPIPTISFVGANEFCLASGAAASFTFGATLVGTTFDAANGFITIKNDVGTPAYTTTLPAGVDNFNVGALGATRVGRYIVEYTYTDTKGCSRTVVCPTPLEFYFYSAPDFLFPATTVFPGGSPNFEVCQNAININLRPFIIASGYGADVSITNARGEYKITKNGGNGFVWTIPGSVVNSPTDSFNPQTLVGDLVNGGLGNYTITYFYETANGCTGNGFARELKINPLPNPAFTFVGTFIGTPAFCVDAISFVLAPSVNGGSVPPATPASFGQFTINKIAGASTGTTFIAFPSANTILLSSLSGVGTYEVTYKYIDIKTCEQTTVAQTFIINPLPVTTISFIADNKFCANEPTGTPFLNLAYVSGAGAFDPAKSSFTITRGAFNTTIPALIGANTFNPSTLANAGTGAGVGIYTVTHKYEDTNSCEQTTAPLTFEIYALPQPAFTFQETPTNTENNLDICANITSVQLNPSVTNLTEFGVGGVFVGVYGQFTFTLGAVTRILPAGVNTFNPLILFAGDDVTVTRVYTVTYTYTIPGFCSNTSILLQELTINPLPVVSFTFTPQPLSPATPIPGYFVDATGNLTVCSTFAPIELIPSTGVVAGVSFSIQEIGTPIPTAPLISSVIGTTTITLSTLAIQNAPPTTTTNPRIFNIRFIYTNGSGCIGMSGTRTLTVIPLPEPRFIIPNQRCVGVPITFDANSSVTQAPADGVISPNGYQWNFDGTTLETTATFTSLPTVAKTFGTSGTFVVSLTIKSVLGCSKTFISNVIIGDIPVAGFTTASFCQGTATTFNSTSTLLGGGSIDTYDWNFDTSQAPTPATTATTTTPNTTYLYSAPGRYTVTLTVTTDKLCTNTFTRDVLIFPVVTPTAATPYKENFDTNDGFWLANGLIKSTTNPTQDVAGYSWKRGVPTGAKINATTTAGGAWSTSGNLNSFYPNERSYVESPCFNFTDPTLTKPIISMKIWYDTDRGSDGGVLYSSINDGASWQVVGAINDGIEWYNTAGVIAQPGGQPVVNAWTGNTFTAFKVAKFNLDQFRTLPSVRFRIAFGSNADNPVGQIFDGFAFDEIFIGNRNRIALLEHFTNASSSDANTENTFINNFPSVGVQNEIYNIQYHTNVPGADPMNADNTAVPSARALFYGVSQVPRTAIDGVIENRKFSEWGTPVFNKRTLETSPFELSVDFSSTAQQLRFKANVRALEPFTRRVILQTVVIEQEILGTAFTGGNFGGLTFKNIVKGMIPNASGTLIAQTWLQNTQFQTGELVWANVPKIYNGNRLVLVIFVQDEVTREIYQTGFFNITTNIVQQDPTTALDNTTLENEFVVYPNPAQNEVFTGFRDEIAEDFSVVLFDSYGKKVDDFSLTKGNKGLLINTEKYASGMYFVEITGKNNSKARRKLVIAR